MGFHWSNFSKPNTEFNSYLVLCISLAFPIMKREVRGKKFQSDRQSAACFWEAGGALQEVHRLWREVLQKRDHHHPSTKFRLRVIMWVHVLCKWPLYNEGLLI
jgi:hypothetical protein